MKTIILALAALLAATGASAADLSISIRTPAGQPVGDAVVTVYPAGGTGGAPIHFDWPNLMTQQDIQFHPFVLIVPVGATVSFPNRDKVRHHVYSFSPAKKFELKLYSRDENETVRFEKPGAVALGCNIHDTMVAFIKVVDTPFAAKSEANGEAQIHGLPPGAVTVHVWQPYLKSPNNEIQRTVALSAGGGHETVTVDLRTPPAMVMRHGM
jgi:hypothetical protein